MWWGCIDFGKITASFSYVVRSYLSCTKTTSLFYCFSGIVEAVASNSLLDDLPSVSDLDAIKTEGEQTLPTDAALSKFSQVDIKEVNAACPQQGIFESYMNGLYYYNK